jgi:hypothetical protein
MDFMVSIKALEETIGRGEKYGAARLERIWRIVEKLSPESFRSVCEGLAVVSRSLPGPQDWREAVETCMQRLREIIRTKESQEQEPIVSRIPVEERRHICQMIMARLRSETNDSDWERFLGDLKSACGRPA